MQLILLLVCLFCVSQDILGRRIEQRSINYNDEISYQDLINLNASCFPKDSCIEVRHDDLYGFPYRYRCSCDRQCWKFGTCCIDSPYRVNDPPIQKCITTGVKFLSPSYYIVHRCPGSTDIDYPWKNLCEKEWNGEDDILMLSPVTSLDTSVTYKNYYCFRCHENTDKYLSWNLNLSSKYKSSGDRNSYGDYNDTSVYNYDDGNSDSKRDYSVTYDQARKTWVATEVENTMIKNPISLPVNLTFLVPNERQISLISCVPGIISDCPNTWTDKQMHHKCLAYTAVVYKGSLLYKNPHCALCNYEYLGNITCEQTAFDGLGGPGYFSFSYLMDLHKSGEDKAGKAGKCGDDHLWDPYSKECRKTTCAVPGYVIKNNRCSPP